MPRTVTRSLPLTSTPLSALTKARSRTQQSCTNCSSTPL